MVKTVDDLADAQLNLTKVTKVRSLTKCHLESLRRFEIPLSDINKT